MNFLERHVDMYRIRVILFSALIRVSSLEQGIKTKLNLVTSGTPPPKFLFSTPAPPGSYCHFPSQYSVKNVCDCIDPYLQCFKSQLFHVFVFVSFCQYARYPPDVSLDRIVTELRMKVK